MPARLLTAQPQPQLSKPEAEVAPVMGMDGTLPLFNMPQGTAVYLYNLLPTEYGAQTRAGDRVWAQGLAGGDVRSILPFNSQVFGGTESRLFGVTPSGIYDCTTQGTDTPIAVVTFPDTSLDAGFCTFLHHTDPAGNQVLLVADARNGMYQYNPTGAVWTKYTSEITGVDPTKVAFIMNHKGRIWMIERDSSDAWYLPVGQRTGAATKFQLGSKMKHGGYLVGLYSWSVDGGDGVDDYLLAVSKAGDLLAYRGSDPAFADKWDLVGKFFIGEVPENRRIASETGGDTILLSVFGATSVEQLLSGIDPNKTERNVTAKIARFIRTAIADKITLPYWEIKFLMAENLMVINSPRRVNEDYIQYALNINRVSEESGGGWGLMRGVGATTFESYNGTSYFGTEDGKIKQIFGSLDGVDIDGAGGEPVAFSGLGRFTNYGSPANKQVTFIRPAFVTSNVLTYSTKAVYDFQLSEIVDSAVAGVVSGALWDVAIWDQAIWSGLSTDSKVGASQGFGRNVAIAIRGSAVQRSTLVNTELMWQPWGFL